MIDVLYIHPYGHSMRHILPVGLIGLMNSLPYSKYGIMDYEINEETLSQSKIIVMAMHWYMSLAGIKSLLPKIRKYFRGPIITGGYTATILAQEIIEKLDIDYIITGDAEYPFVRLIESLLNGEDVKKVHNLVTKSFTTEQKYKANTDDYSSLDCITIDWFPSLKERINHILSNSNISDIFAWYPLIPVFKGCKYNCEYCYGNPILQKQIFGRSMVERTPESVIYDLKRCSEQTEISQVYFVSDFICSLGKNYSKTVLSYRYNLDVIYEFYDLPKVSDIELLANSFSTCNLLFSARNHHNTHLSEDRANALCSVWNRLQSENIRLGLYYNSESHEEIEILKNLAKIFPDFDRIKLFDNRKWYIPVPYPSSYGKEQENLSFWMNEAQVSIHLTRSKRLQMNGKCLSALTELQKAERIYPCSSMQREFIYFSFGNLLYKMGRYFEAISYLRKYINLSKSPSPGIYFMGKCFDKTGDTSEANKLYNQASNINPFLDKEFLETQLTQSL